MVSEAQILKATKPGDIFTNDFNIARSEYKALVKKYHPDVCKSPKAKDIFQKITEFYNDALEEIANKTWSKTNLIKINKKSGKGVEITFLTTFNFELGVCYVCNNHIVYVFDSDKKKYRDNMVDILKTLKYRDREMEEEFSRYFPKIVDTYETAEGKYCVVLTKTPDVFPLKSLHEFYKGKIPDRHVAWIMSRLSNISCFLKYNGIIHNGISIENCYISPEHHAMMLYGGWWYAVKEKTNMIGTTKEIYDLMPVSAKSSKIASYITDLESIKYIGRSLLGDSNCRTLAAKATIPKSILEFLIKGSGDDAYKEFKDWDAALDKGYGIRKFIPLNVTKEQIYNLT